MLQDMHVQKAQSGLSWRNISLHKILFWVPGGCISHAELLVCACRKQPPGFQRILRLGHHSSQLTAISIAASLGLVACGDEAGVVSVLDLTQVWPASWLSDTFSHRSLTPSFFIGAISLTSPALAVALSAD